MLNIIINYFNVYIFAQFIHSFIEHTFMLVLRYTRYILWPFLVLDKGKKGREIKNGRENKQSKIPQIADPNFCTFTTTYTNTEKFIHWLNKYQTSSKNQTMLGSGYKIKGREVLALKLLKIKSKSTNICHCRPYDFS